MSTKHTPGPWYASNLWLPKDVGDPYAYPLGCDPDTAVANARLLAAAPDLYAAATAFLACVVASSLTEEERDGLSYLRAALRKAEGE